MLVDQHGKPTATHDSSKLALMGLDYARRAGACQYYRIRVPFNALEQMGHAFTHIDDGTSDAMLSTQAMLHSDIVQMYAVDSDLMGATVQTIRAMKPQLNDEGVLRVPPSVVYDIDDNNDYVHPFNPAFERLGYRTYPDGKVMAPGDNITIALADGTEKVLWNDGETIGSNGQLFNIARNRHTVSAQMQLARLCDAVTVPSKALAQYFRVVQKCENVYVFPNTVVPSDWYFPNLVPRTDGKVRILWQGGDSHTIDWVPLKGAIGEICRKYPNVEIVIWGAASPWITDEVPADQLQVWKWVDYAGYRPLRAVIDCDINLAPLADNVFNRCKSAIKWYEASLGPRPEATLAANVEPYRLEMVDGETGLLYNTPEEFVQKLSALIESADLRHKLAQGAQQWVLANRTPEATIPGLLAFYQELRARRRQEYYAQ